MSDHNPVIPREPRYSSSIQHGLAMMQCFTAEDRLRGIADLADLLALNRSTTHRYAVTLVALGFLEQTPSRKYLLAARSAAVGMAALGEIAKRSGCEPVLAQLRQQSRHTVGLAVLDGTRAIYVRRLPAHLKGQYEADMDLRSGAHVPLYCTALGKVLLASLPDERKQELVAGIDLARRGPNSIRAKRAFLQELDRVKRDGLAVSDEEIAAGVRSIAVAVADPTGGRQLAVDVNVPSSAYTLDEIRRQIGPLVSAAAESIAARLAGGGRVPARR
jgi:IclR family pca regulon transcriptional regulator